MKTPKMSASFHISYSSSKDTSLNDVRTSQMYKVYPVGRHMTRTTKKTAFVGSRQKRIKSFFSSISTFNIHVQRSERSHCREGLRSSYVAFTSRIILTLTMLQYVFISQTWKDHNIKRQSKFVIDLFCKQDNLFIQFWIV